MTGPGRRPQIPLPFSGTDRLTFELFSAGDNAELLSMLGQLASGTVRQDLYLWGEPGSGKSHLLNACCNGARSHGRRAALVPLADHLTLSTGMLEGLEQCELVCVDDLDAIAGDAAWEQAVFHLYNRVRDAGGNLLLAARSSPATSPLQLADLRSRLPWGLVFRVAGLGEAERFGVLRGRARQRGMDIPDEVLEYLSKRIPRDMHSLIGWLERLDHESLAAGRRLTVPFVRELIDSQSTGRES